VHSHGDEETRAGVLLPLNPYRRVIPHNPLLNAGAIACSSLIRPNAELSDRIEHLMRTWQRLTGRRLAVNSTVFLSERATANRNHCLAHFMRENDVFPPGTSLKETLELYFMACSVSANVRDMAVMAASLANGGKNPLSYDRIFRPTTVQNVLALMQTCGMNNTSGRFSFETGCPSKSGVGGCIFTVVPNVCGIAVWSPRVDVTGNSVRGVEFLRRLGDLYSVHLFSKVRGIGEVSKKEDMTKARRTSAIELTLRLVFAASTGDLPEVKALLATGVDVNAGDWDMRRALHVAAAEGHLPVVRELLARGAEVNARDRWDGTPLTDARLAGQEAVAQALLDAGAIE